MSFLNINMIIVAILVLRFLVKLRFPANTPISTFDGMFVKITFMRVSEASAILVGFWIICLNMFKNMFKICLKCQICLK